jgi:hypothetical protein
MAAQKPNLNPFPAWRLPKGIIKACDGDLERSIGSCERWEWCGGVLVVLGVLAEVAIAAIHPPYDSFLEQWGSTVANSLIAIGVVTEIRFGQMAGLRQSELMRRSDERVAEANTRAANAELETQRLKAQFGGRRILPEQAKQIVETIRDKASSLNVLIEFQSGDPEAYTYGVDFIHVFQDSGVEKIRFCGNAYISGMVFGLWLSTAPEIDGSSIADSFTNAGVPMKIGNVDLSKHLPRNEVPPNLYIFVAPKLLPFTPVVVAKNEPTDTSNTTIKP